MVYLPLRCQFRFGQEKWYFPPSLGSSSASGGHHFFNRSGSVQRSKRDSLFMWGNSATMVILSVDVSVFSSRGLLVVKGNNPTRVNSQSVGKLLIHTFRVFVRIAGRPGRFRSSLRASVCKRSERCGQDCGWFDCCYQRRSTAACIYHPGCRLGRSFQRCRKHSGNLCFRTIVPSIHPRPCQGSSWRIVCSLGSRRGNRLGCCHDPSLYSSLVYSHHYWSDRLPTHLSLRYKRYPMECPPAKGSIAHGSQPIPRTTRNLRLPSASTWSFSDERAGTRKSQDSSLGLRSSNLVLERNQ